MAHQIKFKQALVGYYIKFNLDALKTYVKQPKL